MLFPVTPFQNRDPEHGLDLPDSITDRREKSGRRKAQTCLLAVDPGELVAGKVREQVQFGADVDYGKQQSFERILAVQGSARSRSCSFPISARHHTSRRGGELEPQLDPQFPRPAVPCAAVYAARKVASGSSGASSLAILAFCHSRFPGNRTAAVYFSRTPGFSRPHWYRR